MNELDELNRIDTSALCFALIVVLFALLVICLVARQIVKDISTNRNKTTSNE
jgi:hypothetical protein